MRPPFRVIVAFLFAARLYSPAPASSAPTYRLTEVTLPSTPRTASAINSVGQIVVSLITGGAYLWTPTSPNASTGNLTVFPKPADLGTWIPTGINDSGQVVGQGSLNLYVWTPAFPNTGTGQFYALPAVPNSDIAPQSRALGVNNAGQVTGIANVGGTQHAILWSPATPNGTTYFPNDLGAATALPKDSSGYAINSAGQIAGHNYITTPGGYYAPRAAVWTPDSPNGSAGAFHPLTPPAPDQPSTDYSYALALNDAGDTVGYGTLNFNGIATFHAILWPANTSSFVDLGGPAESRANAINSSQSVVGYANYPTAGQHAFLWTPSTGMLDLNSLLDPTDAGWTLYTATGINAAGQILGIGRDPAGRTQPFLLTLLPEPSLLLLPALIGLTLRRNRR